TYNLGFKNMYLGQGDSFVYTPVLEYYVNVLDGLYSVRILPVIGNSIQNYITGNLSYLVKIVNTTAIETVESARVSVFPNPAQDYAVITAPTAGDAPVVLFDQAGRIVAKTTLTAGTGRIELSQLPSGTYIIRIDDYTGKLIIAH
ncbi:T9SS type A sorting domain-containing protein, partial [Bacteroides heparinolyticus]|uniref:T9SS type A sorting domain-containing protein n=1 Tax=Prevotella heparinolytica TaxID=28113 RepID=UPI0035A06902